MLKIIFFLLSLNNLNCFANPPKYQKTIGLPYWNPAEQKMGIFELEAPGFKSSVPISLKYTIKTKLGPEQTFHQNKLASFVSKYQSFLRSIINSENIETAKEKMRNAHLFLIDKIFPRENKNLLIRYLATFMQEIILGLESDENNKLNLYLNISLVLEEIYNRNFQNVEDFKTLALILMGREDEDFLPNIEHIQFACPQDYSESYILRQSLPGYEFSLIKISKQEGLRKLEESQDLKRNSITRSQEQTFNHLKKQFNKGLAPNAEPREIEVSTATLPISHPQSAGSVPKTGAKFDSSTIESFEQNELDELNKSKESIKKEIKKETLARFEFVQGKRQKDQAKILRLKQILNLDDNTFNQLLNLIKKIIEISKSNDKAEVLEAEIEKNLLKFKQKGSAVHYKLNLPNASISMIFHLNHGKETLAKQSSAFNGAIRFLGKIKNLLNSYKMIFN
jgi:hypothetical protein